MKSSLFLSTFLAGVPSLCKVVVHPDTTEAGLLRAPRQRDLELDPFHQVRDVDLMDLDRRGNSSQHVATFDLASTIPPGLFLNVNAGHKESNGISETIMISASCASCYTTGTGVATTPGIDTDDSVFHDIIKFIEELGKDPEEVIKDAFNVQMDFALKNFSGHFDFDIAFTGSGTYDISIPLPPTPLGGTFPDPPIPDAPSTTIGLVPTIDIIFFVSGAVHVSTGFEFTFPEDATFSIDAIKGDIIQTNFGNVKFNSLPTTFKSGVGTVSVKLRFGAKLAFDFHVLNKGFSLESGIFTDVPSYSAAITFNPSLPCEVALSEVLAIDAGAFATAAATLGSFNAGLGPSFITSLVTMSLPGTCIESKTASNFTTAAPATTASAKTTAGTSSHSQVVITNSLHASSLASHVTGPFITGTPVYDTSKTGTPSSTSAKRRDLDPRAVATTTPIVQNITVITTTYTSTSSAKSWPATNGTSTPTASSVPSPVPLSSAGISTSPFLPLFAGISLLFMFFA